MARRTHHTAILFFSHVFTPTAVGHLEKLKRESADFGTFFVYADISGQNPRHSSADVVRFDFDAIRKDYPNVLGRTLVPGNCHLTLLDFFKRYPDFDYYWVVEYDVMFTGDWRTFFAAFADRDADFLACHLRRREEEPEFCFWSTIQAPAGVPPPKSFVRAFCPIQRVSRRSLELLQVKAREGWVGHFEGLVPTLLHNHGFSLADIGGDGAFVPPGFRNRFYTSFSWKDGRLRHFGSMRYRPLRYSTRLTSGNTLYHPVKHESTRLVPRSTLAEMKGRLAYVAQNLESSPVDFSWALARLISRAR